MVKHANQQSTSQDAVLRLAVFTFGILLTITVLATAIATNVKVNAVTTSANASVNVSAACTLSGGATYVDNIPNNSSKTFGPGTLRATCNDPDGYSIYAIGYSNDTYGNTSMVSTTDPTSSTNIPTNTTGSNSWWAMQLSATGATIQNNFDSLHVIPDTYTKVATKTSVAAGTTGESTVNSNYTVNISSTQAAGTYNGKVKYTLVHPNTAPAPSTNYYMQDVATWGSTLNTGDEITAIDNRDNKEYTVAKLADGNIWMTQNLDFDIDSTKTYTSADTDISASWTPSTSTYATSTTTWNGSYTAPESYDPGNVCWDGTMNDDWDGTLDNETVSCTAPNHYHIGNYYNWTAAVAMNDSTSYATDKTDVDQSICPAGWRLPTYSGNKSYDNLVTTLNLTAGSETSAGANGNIQNSPVFFPYAGGWYGNSGGVGGYSTYWSSVVWDSLSAYDLDFTVDGGLGPQGFSDRSYGFSVRCVAR